MKVIFKRILKRVRKLRMILENFRKLSNSNHDFASLQNNLHLLKYFNDT